MAYGDLHGADGVLVENAGFTGTLASGSQGAGGRTYLDNTLSLLKATFGGVDAMVAESGSAVPRLLVELLAGIQLSVKDFGAKGDGLADDTSAIGLALNRCSARGGGRVYLDPGTYLISSQLIMQSNVALVGAGSAVSVIKCTDAGQNCINIAGSGTGNNRLEGIGISHSSTSTGTAVTCTSRTGVVLRDVVIGDALFANGVVFTACSRTVIYDSTLACVSNAANRALKYATSGTDHIVLGSIFKSGAGICVECATGASSITIFGSTFFSGSVGVKITSSDNTDFIQVIGCRGLNANMGTPFTATAPFARALKSIGNFAVNPSTTAVTSGSTVTPEPLLQGPVFLYRGTTTGSAYIVAPPTNLPFDVGSELTLRFHNNAGGAVTGWTLDVIYVKSAIIPVGDTLKTTVTFFWDGTAYHERSRSSF